MDSWIWIFVERSRKFFRKKESYAEAKVSKTAFDMCAG